MHYMFLMQHAPAVSQCVLCIPPCPCISVAYSFSYHAACLPVAACCCLSYPADLLSCPVPQAKICAQLDGALLTDEELATYTTKWAALPDPVHPGAPQASNLV
jgi:hypothetical protein